MTIRERLYEKINIIAMEERRIKLSEFTSEEAAELYALNSEVAWIFEPNEFASRLEADPDCVICIWTFGEPTDEQVVLFSRMFEMLGI